MPFNKFYKVVDGNIKELAQASTFMYKFKNKWIKDCPHVLKSVFYRQYVDDIFVMFSFNHAEKFKKYLSSKHLNINFLLEKENDGSVSFSNVNIFHKKGKHVTNFY